MWLIIESNHTQIELAHLPLCASRLSGDTFERTYRREQKKCNLYLWKDLNATKFYYIEISKKSEKVGLKLETSAHGTISSFFKHCRRIKMRKYLHITKATADMENKVFVKKDVDGQSRWKQKQVQWLQKKMETIFLHREILKKPKPQLCEKKKRYCIRTVPPDLVILKNIEDFQ